MVLSILIKNEDSLSFVGSGFITNKRGLAITAAHNFIEHQASIENIRVAFPSLGNPSHLFKIRILYNEYLNPIHLNEQDQRRRLPFYKDLTLFRVLLYKFDNCLKLQLKRSLSNETLSINGFHNPTHQDFSCVNNQADLSTLIPVNFSVLIKHRYFSIFSSRETDYEINPDLVDIVKKYNNCMTLRYSSFHGVSGGPILNAVGKVVAIYLGGNQHLHYSNILCSRYIRKKNRLMKE